MTAASPPPSSPDHEGGPQAVDELGEDVLAEHGGAEPVLGRGRRGGDADVGVGVALGDIGAARPSRAAGDQHDQPRQELAVAQREVQALVAPRGKPPRRLSAPRTAGPVGHGRHAGLASHSGPGTRVDQDVDDVDDEVGDQHAHDDEQEGPLQQEEVLVLDRLEDQVAEPRIGEDDLGDQGAGHEHAELQGQAGDLRQHRVPERVAPDQPLGRAERGQVGGVVGLQLVDDHVAHADRPAAERDEEERDERQEPVQRAGLPTNSHDQVGRMAKL